MGMEVSSSLSSAAVPGLAGENPTVQRVLRDTHEWEQLCEAVEMWKNPKAKPQPSQHHLGPPISGLDAAATSQPMPLIQHSGGSLPPVDGTLLCIIKA